MTGVQTCALPICKAAAPFPHDERCADDVFIDHALHLPVAQIGQESRRGSGHPLKLHARSNIIPKVRISLSRRLCWRNVFGLLTQQGQR